MAYAPEVVAKSELHERRFGGRWSTVTLVVLVAGAIVMSLPHLDAWRAAVTLGLSLCFLCATLFGARYVEQLAPPSRWRALAALMAVQLALATSLAFSSRGFAILLFFATASQAVLYARPRWAALVVVLCVVLTSVSFWFHSPAYAVQQFVSLATSMAFVVAFSSAIARQGDARRESERLATELAAANVRLAANADATAHLAAERERNRIAREIHDTVGHHLTAAHVQLLAARAVLDHDPARAGVALDRASNLTRNALEEVRRAVIVMRNEPGSPLPDRLARLLEEVAVASLRGELTVIGAPRRLPMSVEVALYRAAQEAITNVYRHARASRIEITVTYAPEGRVALHIRDDGVDDELARPAPGIGLELMGERMRELGGELAIERSASGFGLTLAVPG